MRARGSWRGIVPVLSVSLGVGCTAGGGTEGRDAGANRPDAPAEATPPRPDAAARDANGDARRDAPAPPSSTTAKLLALGAAPCGHAGDFLCVTLPVPLDHFGARPGETIGVTFAVHPAPVATRRGMLVNAAGGPGYSGTEGMSTWAYLSPRFPAEFDVVYFDLRGVNRSGHLECTSAAAAFYLGGLRVASAADEVTLDDKAQAFAKDCPAEMGIPLDDVAYYSTAQAIEDLEDFREAMGDDGLSLYGLSYGTQFMQTYAAKYGAHVRALVLDGTVNLALSHIGFMDDLTDDINALLDETLADCATRRECAARVAAAPGSSPAAKPAGAYAALAAELQANPVVVPFPLDDGGASPRDFARFDLDTTTFNAMYDPTSRRGFERAMGIAFDRATWLPMLDLYYGSAGIDGQTAGPVGTASADPGMSDAIYYAVTCNDYGLDAPTAAERKATWLAAGRAHWATDSVLSPFYGDYPCVYWPTPYAAKTVPPLTLAGVPTLIVGATGDGAVPVDEGQAVAAGLDDGYQVLVEGGQHVMYGRGLPCVDDLATAFLLDLTRPASRTTTCQGSFVR